MKPKLQWVEPDKNLGYRTKMPKIIAQYGIPTSTTPAPEPNVTDTPTTEDLSQKEEKDKQLRQQEKRVLNQQMRLMRDKLQMLQAQLTPIKQNEDQFDDLNRQEEAEQEELARQKDTDVMNKMIQQNQQNQQNMSTQVMTMQSSRWVRSEKADAKILFNNKIAIICDVAATPRQQASGLQAYAVLPKDRGLWFPQNGSRVAAFHMGDVKFPIDIIFANDGRINKIIANVTPGRFGTWSSICTDVIEANAGWCRENDIMVGDELQTPLNKAGNKHTYEPLRGITEAETEDNFEEELLQTFPFLRQAKENRLPGGVDNDQTVRTSPLVRFEHNTLPDESSPFGDGDSADVDPFTGMGNPNGSDGGGGFSSKHFDYTRGFDPSLAEPERKSVTPISPRSDGLLAPIRPAAAKMGIKIDPKKLIDGSVQLYKDHTPDWVKEEENGGITAEAVHEEMAVITADTIQNWIDALGFEERNAEALQQVMFTDSYKSDLGEELQDQGLIKDFKLFDSDLLIYR